MVQEFHECLDFHVYAGRGLANALGNLVGLAVVKGAAAEAGHHGLGVRIITKQLNMKYCNSSYVEKYERKSSPGHRHVASVLGFPATSLRGSSSTHQQLVPEFCKKWT